MGPTLTSRPTSRAFGPAARSVVVPVIAVGVLCVTGLALFLTGWVTALASSGSDELTAAECRARTAEVDGAIDAYLSVEGVPPQSQDDLVPRYRGRGTGPTRWWCGATARRRPSSPAASATRRRVVEPHQRARRRRRGAQGLGTDGWLIAGGWTLLGAAFLMACWWLAAAYRCLPAQLQAVKPTRAFRLARIYLACSLVLNLLIGFIATTENDIDAIVGSLVYVLFLIGFLVAMRFAALHWIGMLRDVNRRFGGHVIFASIARTAVQLATIVGALSLFMVWFLGLLLIAFYPALVIASAVVLLAGLVGILAVGVAMVLGTVHIERELAEAAEELDLVAQGVPPSSAAAPPTPP